MTTTPMAGGTSMDRITAPLGALISVGSTLVSLVAAPCIGVKSFPGIAALDASAYLARGSVFLLVLASWVTMVVLPMRRRAAVTVPLGLLNAVVAAMGMILLGY